MILSIYYYYNYPQQQAAPPQTLPKEGGTSVFDIPEKVENGVASPIYNDTGQKEVLVLNRGEFAKAPIGSEPYFGYCIQSFPDIYDGSSPIGTSDNPISVEVGSQDPATISFCAYNGDTRDALMNKTDSPYVWYLVVQQIHESQLNPNISTSLEGLNFSLSTRVVSLPQIKLDWKNGNITQVEITKETIYLYIRADENAKEGIHVFGLDFMHPDSNTGGSFQNDVPAIYVNVHK